MVTPATIATPSVVTARAISAHIVDRTDRILIHSACITLSTR
jgi:hypothetical protein